jgi:type I restriction enzyme S subunit
MTALLTDNLPLLAGAPNGIKKLRELILELAVRGKLVPQDANDVPASELLKRIAQEKARLAAEGKIKNPKPLANLQQEDQSDDLPEGWALSRLGEVVNICTGKLDANAAVPGGEYPFFTCSQTPSSIATYSFDTAAVLLAGNGDFNLKKFQGRFDAYQRTYVIEPVIWSLDFCFISVSAEIERITENNRGSAIPYLKLGDITNPVIWMPPLAEQHRIVAKVDELMALCDRLEAQQADAESAHAQLVQALLDSLTQAADAEDFATSWQRLAEHFHTLFTTESSIDALKQTLLQLAVMGKLVPQESNDEPADGLLQKIARRLQELSATRLLN